MSPDRKKIWMWLGVTSVGALIFVVWAASLKYGIMNTAISAAKGAKDGSGYLNDMKMELKRQIDKAKNEGLKQISPVPADAGAESVEATTSSAVKE